MQRLVYGVGINDAGYTIAKRGNLLRDGHTKVLWMCPFYSRWKDMLRRCYDKSFHERQPTYKDCTVCNEWLYFSKFKAWMEQQDWEGKQLDKDILCQGNKLYSPEFCIFVDQNLNKFMSDSGRIGQNLLRGVIYRKEKRKFCSHGHSVETGKVKNLGYYDTEEEAHKSWLAFKLKQAYILAEQQTDERIAQALINRFKNYEIN